MQVSIPTCAGLPWPVLASPSEYRSWLPPCHPLLQVPGPIPTTLHATPAEDPEAEDAQKEVQKKQSERKVQEGKPEQEVGGCNEATLLLGEATRPHTTCAGSDALMHTEF